ncbi:phosphatase PAP2 family protein [Alkalibacillus almallahensis]|uniref:phosphatase PAP2 family protein n=1 Tax=Alkalibacillus almallahensis TaxID=1379154 RepID=UPI0014230133|nr:phosphatase PAP2 family protein [Alkalibacillus almallahensis]NIK11511.1 undecaprenyl-diphosphatase [Alkalibacillus almallahensis]
MRITSIDFQALSRKSLALMLTGFVALFVSFYIFLSLADDVWEDESFKLDAMVNQFIVSFNTPWLTDMMGYITETGSVPWLTVATILVVAYLVLLTDKSYWVATFLVINMLGISGLTKGLKLLFERQRPETLEQFDGTGFSFPSGHSTGAITFYGFMIYLIVISKLSKGWKWVINGFLTTWILLVALSRVFVGVHYVTDIIAGLAIGLAWLLICVTGLVLLRRR